MRCSLRSNISHAILMAAYDHAPEEEIGRFEDGEMPISKLAQAGDSLQEYLGDIEDREIQAALLLIDRRITELRAKYQNFSEALTEPEPICSFDTVNSNLLHTIMTGKKRTVLLGNQNA